MASELIKIYGPFMYFIIWIFYIKKSFSIYFIGAAFFLVSFVAFSQNFTYFYREAHQIIQIFLVAVLIIAVTHGKKLYKFNWLFFIFFKFILISLFSGISEPNITHIVNFIVICLMTNVLIYAVDEKTNYDLFFSLFSSLAICLACVGLVEAVYAEGGRVTGTMANPNFFAYFIGLGFCICFNKYVGLPRLVISTILIAAILASGSRAALLFPVIHLFFYFVFSRKNWIFKVHLLTGLVLVVSLFVFLNSAKFSNEGISGSDAERILFSKIAITMVNDHPFTGIGWGGFAEDFKKYSAGVKPITLSDGGIVDVSRQERRVSHNDFLRVAAELGWIAAIGFLVLCLASLWKAYLHARRGDVYVFTCLAGSLLFSVTHNNLNSVLFWFFLMLPFILRYIVTPPVIPPKNT